MLRPADIERIELRVLKPMHGIAGIDHRASFHETANSAYVTALAAADPAIQNHDMIGGIETRILFLRRGQIERRQTATQSQRQDFCGTEIRQRRNCHRREDPGKR